MVAIENIKVGTRLFQQTPKALKLLRKLYILFNIDGKGRDDEHFCLVIDNGKWNVYYAERECKTTNLYFNTESAALECMLNDLSE